MNKVITIFMLVILVFGIVFSLGFVLAEGNESPGNEGETTNCQMVEYEGNCYDSGDSFIVEQEDIFYTLKEIIEITNIIGSFCVEENGVTMCTNTASNIDLTINYRCVDNSCPNYEEQVTLLKSEQVKLEFTNIILELKSTNMNLETPTATLEVIGLSGDNDNEGKDDKNNELMDEKITICHIPSRNPSNAHTITVGASALRAHLAQGDYEGECQGEEEETEVKIDEELEIEVEEESGQSTIQIRLSNQERKELRISSKEAKEIARERLRVQNLTRIELKESVHKNVPMVVYHIESEKQGKFLGIFKMGMKVSTEIDAESGEVIETSKPWWAFLVAE